MPAPDARTRNKISLNPSKVLSSSIPSKVLPRIFLANALFVLALHATKEWLLDFDIGVFWVLMRVLACGGFGVLIWEGTTSQVAKRKDIEWSALAMASLLLFVQYACLFTALYRLPSTRVIIFAHFSSYWIGTLLTLSSARKVITVILAFSISALSDTYFSSNNLWRYIPGYGALLLHGLSSTAFEHTIGVLSPSLGSTFTIAAATLGASIFALPFYIFRTLVLNSTPTPVLPLISLAAIPFVAYSILFMTPLTTRSLVQRSLTSQHFGSSFPMLAVLSAIFGTLAFSQFPTWTDLVVAVSLFHGAYPDSIEALTAAPRAPTSRLLKAYLKSILSNPESRKIFYFLMLNLCYMLVQMLYGVWTNSLGLISDAIHMAFDCMAIGMGLLASVMATWEPNERFTYGYGRIETLSGFANGIFLILISIFIVFEAIQRILDPPEMNTNQLLLVSSLGLGVNLFGMFAMGGHHHHGGHSHSHGHSHAVPDKAEHAGHSHSEDHSHSHAPAPKVVQAHHHTHSHSHSPPPSVSHPQSHLHTKPHSPTYPSSHSYSHSHSPPPTHAPSHSHSSHPHPPPPPTHTSHDHYDDHDRGHGHGHSHSHSHSPTCEDDHHHPHSRAPSRSEHDHSSSHQSHPMGHSRSMSNSSVSERPGNENGRAIKRHSRGPSLSIQAPHLHDHGVGSVLSPVSPNFQAHLKDVRTPITPNYTFGHDDHYTKHHDVGHTPNLHDHSHGHSHEGHSHNMRGVFLHVMADTLGSVGVIISTLLIQFYGWTGFDPIASMFIAILIAASVIPLVMDTGKILALDVADRDVVIYEALQELASIEGLASYSSPRFWPKDASTLIGSIHIHLARSASSVDPTGPHSSIRTTYTKVDRVVERVDTLLRQKIPGLEELTIQVEGGELAKPFS